MTEKVIATADLSDELGKDAQVLAPLWNNYGGNVAFSGPAATVRCHDDNSKVREMLETPGNGRVLFVNGGGSTQCALLGDMLCELPLKMVGRVLLFMAVCVIQPLCSNCLWASKRGVLIHRKA